MMLHKCEEEFEDVILSKRRAIIKQSSCCDEKLEWNGAVHTPEQTDLTSP